MLVFCEECGKRYSFPPEEVEPDSNQFRCRECQFLMTVSCLKKAGEKVQANSKVVQPAIDKKRDK
ncbi:MAG: zinc-ribbon domain-containing protein [Desulfobulbaceae bacterium]|nr:zinc-ribbon domain-containing protein [Desulfobulbaceae bacterium]